MIVIEHNLEVIKTADYVIDLGPEGGDGGGEVVATGTPEQVAKVAESYTGHYLKQLLDRRGGSTRGGVATSTSGKTASSKPTRNRPTRTEAAE